MEVRDAQREVRSVYMGGFPGQIASSLIWFASAALATWGTRRQAILMLAVGGAFIFPITVLMLLLMRRKPFVSKDNPLNVLAMQIAFTVPLALPVVAGATLYRRDWFYPAVMIIVGAHYLPFGFLYGMWQFPVLGAVLLVLGLRFGLPAPGAFGTPAWITACALVLYAFYALIVTTREARAGASAPR
jgi:hypothetical protein